MVNMFDLFTKEEFSEAFSNNFISMQKHPDYELYIYNYTKLAQITKGAWDSPAVLQCRGLITDNKGNIVARGMPKFFNYGQPEAPDISLDEQVVTMDKVDGSLGILYPIPGYPGEFAVATRGSFTSDQALRATYIWNCKYAGNGNDFGWWRKNDAFDIATPLFEIVYPQNRIVLDYDGMEDLVLLGYMSTVNHIFHPPSSIDSWPGPRATYLPYKSLRSALEAPPRENAEGMVIVADSGRKLVKLKQEDYLELHKIVTGLNKKTVWRHLADGRPLSEFTMNLPDEFIEWTENVAIDLLNQANEITSDARRKFQMVLREVEDPWNRKEFALKVKGHELAKYLFALLDSRDIWQMAWEEIEPRGDERPFGEDND